MIERHLDQIQGTNRYVKLISEDRAFFNGSYLDGRTRFTNNEYWQQKPFNLSDEENVRDILNSR
jgi:hypothetical protein